MTARFGIVDDDNGYHVRFRRSDPQTEEVVR